LAAEAGFANLRVKTLDLDPPAVCVLAINPGRLPDPVIPDTRTPNVVASNTED